eukprot:TRINITY_DN31892_c0_g1_i1.p1 TRINITY_DN31892_c0_g1~~TRINITY_DN31892_c0_g1_i1.p1  ORF type:complete len:720 (-),score=119.42 TRINITY_DN31892_c0_g1_i1:139-2298(-)
MGRFSAHLVLLRKKAGEDDKVQVEVLVHRRSKKVIQGQTFGLVGGGLSKDEVRWSNDVSLPDACCMAVRLRGAVREAAEEAGGGRGPDLVSVSLPEIQSPVSEKILQEEKIAGARLPSSVVELLGKSEHPPVIAVKMGAYAHHFFFHMLEDEVARDWIPRARPGHRWEIDEAALQTHFGYVWVPLSEWGPAMSNGWQLCTWAKQLFHNQRIQVMSAVDGISGLNAFEKRLTKLLRAAEPVVPEAAQVVSAPRPRPKPPDPKQDLQGWVAHVLHGFAKLSEGSNGSALDEIAANFCCNWIVDYEDVTNPVLVDRYTSLAPKESLFCFHGTCHWACRQIAKEGFDPSKRSPALSKIVPYLIGEYVSSDPHVALKYARQKEVGRDSLCLLVVELPASNFEMRNGVWFQHKFGDNANKEDGTTGAATGGVDFGQSTTCVIEDERVLLPRALLTFRPSMSKAGSAMVHYDVGLQGHTAKSISSCLVPGENMPSAVLFDLDMTCWPFTLAIESHGPPYTSMSNEVGVIDHDNKRLRLFKDLPGILLSLHKAQIPIVLCSRSSVPNWCQEVIANCPIDPKNQPNLMFADVIHSASVIRPGLKKIKHLKEIRAALDVPFHQLLFFDDDERNCADGRRLGVRCVKVDRTGVTPDRFVEGLRLFSSPEPEFEEIQGQEEMTEAVPALPTISDRLKVLCAPKGKDATDTGTGARRGDSLRSVMGRLTAAR